VQAGDIIPTSPPLPPSLSPSLTSSSRRVHGAYEGVNFSTQKTQRVPHHREVKVRRRRREGGREGTTVASSW